MTKDEQDKKEYEEFKAQHQERYRLIPDWALKEYWFNPFEKYKEEEMRRIAFEDVERLELISLKLEKIPKEKKNPIIQDMIWLTEKLRDAYHRLENGGKDDKGRTG